MITVNKMTVLRNTFVSTYCELVAERLDLPKWSMPNKWGVLVDKVIDNMKTCRVYDTKDIKGFVEAQFQPFKSRDCLTLFHLKYPPISVFLSPNARQRYRRYVLKEESYKSKNLTDDGIMGIITAGVINYKGVIKEFDYDKIKFGLISGDLSVYTLAYCVCKSVLPAKKVANCVTYATQYTADGLITDYRQAIDRVWKIIRKIEKRKVVTYGN